VWKGRLTQHVLLKVLLLIEQLHVSAMCFAIIRLLHYLLDTYMCKTVGCDILVISRESVAGNVVGMIRIISKFMTKLMCSYVLLLSATLVYCAKVARFFFLS
jgi:hypothetical protein